MRPERRRGGFTLIELIVVVTIVGFLALAAADFNSQIYRTYNAGRTAAMVVSDLRYAMNYMVTRLRDASDAVIVDGGRGIEYRVPVDGTYETGSFRLNGQAIETENGTRLCKYVADARFSLGVDLPTVTIVLTSVGRVGSFEGGAALPVRLEFVVALRNSDL